MASAGDLVVTLTADQAEFTSGMQKASRTVNDFGEVGSKATGHIAKFNIHMLASRSAITTFAAATNQSVGPLSHLVHAFMMAPGAIGAAIAGFLLFREAMNAAAEQEKRTAEIFAETQAFLAEADWADRAAAGYDHIGIAAEQAMAKTVAQINKIEDDINRVKTAGSGWSSTRLTFGLVEDPEVAAISKKYEKQLDDLYARKNRLLKISQEHQGQEHQHAGGGTRHLASIGSIAGGAFQAEHSQEVVLYKILDAINKGNNNPQPARATP